MITPSNQNHLVFIRVWQETTSSSSLKLGSEELHAALTEKFNTKHRHMPRVLLVATLKVIPSIYSEL